MAYRSSNHSFVRRQFFIARDQSEFLRKIAYKKNVSQARIVRDALREFAKHHRTKLAPEPASMKYDE
jgi:hypothetical protein